MNRLLFCFVLVLGNLACITAIYSQEKPRLVASSNYDDQILIHRLDSAEPIVTQATKSDFRPYLHPIVAPDGNGILTEFSPEHHQHQTGLYWGFTRVNGRDYFHHPEGSHWKRESARVLKAESTGPGNRVQWQTVNELLDEAGNGVLLAQQAGRNAEFLTPEKAVEGMTLQDGFQANVYAAEPMMTQPMAFCWDAKGRMWIAENRDYETRQTGFSNDGNSRIIILEDTDHDGDADSRKVFLEGIPFPSAIAVGMGGLWLGAPPNLLFVPDRNNDDQADLDDIEVRLTGWGIRDRHETLNSFIWGPDGWLYGLQGFATPSKVGKPDGNGRIYKHKEPFPENIPFADEPIDINGGVWRYHPTKDRFEVVAHGFSNPWGVDYDSKGQLFITACVIPHLWHVIPGGIYHRQGGSHFNPHVYSDIRTIADHAHQSAHGGARVYQSDAFPEKYKGRIFMANIHEHAVLTDILEPKGSGYVGHHGDDFALANNAQWIGFSMEVGPDGAIYVLDWHDADICGKEVLNKETGRVFRIAAKQSAAVNFIGRYADLTKLDDVVLAKMQKVESVWHVNQARTILQYRAENRAIDPAAVNFLLNQFQNGESVDLRLRAMWALHVVHFLPDEILQSSLLDAGEHIRAWAIQLLCEDQHAAPTALAQFASMAAKDTSPVVRLYLASAVQRLDAAAKWNILEGLTQHEEDSTDHNLPNMIWFGLEPIVLQDVHRALALAESSRIPLITRHISRRLGAAERFSELLEKIGSSQGNVQLEMLLGLRDSVEGRYDMKSPASWSDFYLKIRAVGGQPAQIALQLSQQFGDSVAAEAMLQTLRDESALTSDRRQALQGLAGRNRLEIKPQLILLLQEESLRRDAIRAMAAFDDTIFAKELLGRYNDFSAEDKQEVVNMLSSRSGSGAALTEALRRGDVPKSDIPAYVARLLRRVVGNSFVDVWGSIDELGVDKEASFAKYRELLKAESIDDADAANGRALFNRTCAACHKLHGFGGEVGPDITGANRSNLEYLLSNIVTPSAIIQDAYKMHMVLMNDGRVYSGIPAEENERQLKLRIADRPEPITLLKSEIESRETAAVSMMPEGILTNLKDSEVLELFAYLQRSK